MLALWVASAVAQQNVSVVSGNTIFSQDYITSANLPALFGVAIALFAILSTVFFLIHRSTEDRREQSARDAAIGEPRPFLLPLSFFSRRPAEMEQQDY